MAPRKDKATATDKQEPTPKDWRTQLLKLDGAVTERRNVHLDVLRCGSPSINAAFGNGWGLPFGFTLLLAGEPKSGKSTIINSYIGELHKNEPKALVIKIDSEFREEAQTAADDLTKWGIDLERYIAIQRDDPSIIDAIDKDLTEMAQRGMPIRLLVVDSINAFEGFRVEAAKTAERKSNQIGDNARFQQMLMASILRFIRRFKVACIVASHVAAEMDLTEQMRGNKVRSKTSLGANHRIEYWMMVEKNRNKEGRVDLLGNSYAREGGVQMVRSEDEVIGDARAHRIKCKMLNSSFGPINRIAEFTYDYRLGIVAQYEEVYTMGRNSGVIAKGEGNGLVFGEHKWRGKEDAITSLAANPQICEAILLELQRREPGHPLYVAPPEPAISSA